MEPDKRSQLEETFNEFSSLAAPKIGGLAEVMDADVDLFEEDAFVAGLVDQFLKAGTVGNFKSIELNSSIDDRLRRAQREYPRAEQSIQELLRYRQRVVELALALSRAADIPIHWTSGIENS